MLKVKGSVGRRGFLKGAAAGAAGVAQQPEPRAIEARGVVEVTGNEKPGSDFMVELDIELLRGEPGFELQREREPSQSSSGER